LVCHHQLDVVAGHYLSLAALDARHFQLSFFCKS
jgi:hypothetical protein